MFGRNERGKRSGAPKSAAGHTAAEGAKRLQESVSGHPLRVAKSLTGQRPYMCCNGQAKDLVSARFRRPPGPEVDLRARRGATVEGHAGVSQGALDNMDSFEINKLLGALLGTIFVIFSITLVSDALFAVHAPENPGYAIEATEEAAGEAAGAQQAEADVAAQVLPLIASANPDAGATVFKKCQACHDATQGGPNKVGPNLWDVVNRPIASHEGFSYSGALKEFSEGGQKTWTYENLAHFLHSPKAVV